ncbi:MAG: hypothetical protein LAN71_02765 [Acidobacteriia bacterium]|nr:hypothetical protein [Terriglobia bacterium]
MEQSRKITRAELYEKVWKTPMQKLAAEFGLSDVGLAKLCKRHQIPVPGRGYWARLQFGQKPTRTRLPNIADVALDSILIVPHEKRPPEIPRLMPNQPAPVIEISENRSITHRHVLRVDKSILRCKKDKRGMPVAKQGRLVPVDVSLESLPRALRILDALFDALDGAGYCIEWGSPYTSPVNVIVLNEKITLSISEIIERKQHKITLEETSHQKIDSWWSPPRWDYTLTGRLKFTLLSTEASHLQHTWADRKKQSLESRVGEIFLSFEFTANSVKKYREDCAEAARQRAEEQKRAAERRRQEEEYNRKFEVVSKFAHAWREAVQLREFATSLKKSAGSPAVPLEQKLAIVRILDWIERHANYIDPLTDVGEIIRRFKKSEWQWNY